MKAGAKIITGTFIVAAAVGLALLMITIPATWKGSAAGFHVPLALYGVTACLHVGAAILFLSSLGAYKTKLRRAYLAISAAIVLAALGTLQLPIINGFDKWDSAWAQDGGVVLPFLLSGLMMYVGTRSFGRLVGVKTVLTKASVVLPAVLVLSIATALLPHVASPTVEKAFDASNTITAWSALMDLAAALIILRVRRQVGEHYREAMSWLAATFIMGFIILAVVIVHSLFTINTQDWLNHTINVVAVFVGLMWIGSGYAFARTKDV